MVSVRFSRWGYVCPLSQWAVGRFRKTPTVHNRTISLVTYLVGIGSLYCVCAEETTRRLVV